MADFCHRCGGELAFAGDESSFCQHCGAPQLRVNEEDVEFKSTTSDSTAKTESGVQLEHLVWTTAVGYAGVVAVSSVALWTGVFWLPSAFPFVWLWTVCGGLTVLGLYKRKHPSSFVNARVGAKIGLVYGLLAAVALAVLIAGAGLVARFGLHTMGTLDALLSNALRQAAEQQAAQPGSVTLSAEQMRVFYSPEVRAGLGLVLLAAGSMFLMVFSTVGGAVGGMIQMRRPGPHRGGGN